MRRRGTLTVFQQGVADIKVNESAIVLTVLGTLAHDIITEAIVDQKFLVFLNGTQVFPKVNETLPPLLDASTSKKALGTLFPQPYLMLLVCYNI